jgi:hypothetical protein
MARDGSKLDLVGLPWTRPRGGQENRCGEPPRRRVDEHRPHHRQVRVERMISDLDIWRVPAEICSEARFFPLGALGLG